jgi:Flp pilus assembly protein TadD
VLDIDEKMQPLKTLQDELGLAPLFQRLNSQLLPAQMAFAHFTFGLILRILRRQEEAERAFRKANELQPSVITLLELVRCLGEQDKHRDALPFAREAVKIGPLNTGAWGNLAMCLISCGEREEARKAIDYAIELDPQDSINQYIRDNFEDYFKKP